MAKKNATAFVDSSAVDDVLPKSVGAEYPWRQHPCRRAEFVSKEHTSRTSSTMNTIWEVAGVRKPLISASVCSREVTSYRTRSRGSSARLETQLRLRGPVVCSPYGCGFQRVFTSRAEHESYHEEKACKTVHPEGRTRNSHAVWLVTDASDRADVDMDELVDPDGLG